MDDGRFTTALPVQSWALVRWPAECQNEIDCKITADLFHLLHDTDKTRMKGDKTAFEPQHSISSNSNILNRFNPVQIPKDEWL